jgi:triosephosphate isomerase (TIM)
MRKLLAANWKMHLTLPQAQDLVRAIAAGAVDRPGHFPVALCVPSPYLLLVSTTVQTLPGVYTGAQNLNEHPQGPYTGEVSGPMLRSCGATYVLVGHSERRQLFLEDNGTIRHKLERALAEGLRPILCIGETLHERAAGHWQAVIEQQLTTALLPLNESALKAVVIAYEPIWAIGTGQTATPQQAAEVHDYIRRLLGPAGQKITVLYGGSVKPENAAELFAHNTIDGALVGGASLDAEAFLAILDAMK